MNWFVTAHVFYLGLSNRQGSSLTIRHISASLWLLSYVRNHESCILHFENVAIGLDQMQEYMTHDMKLSPESIDNLYLAFNQLRKLLNLPEKIYNPLSLQSISTQHVASFFTHETAPLIHTLEIPESLKEDIKRCVY